MASTKSSFAFYFLAIIFFILYFKVLAYVSNMLLPFTPEASLISILLLVVIVMPLSFLSANLLVKLIKNG